MKMKQYGLEYSGEEIISRRQKGKDKDGGEDVRETSSSVGHITNYPVGLKVAVFRSGQHGTFSMCPSPQPKSSERERE